MNDNEFKQTLTKILTLEDIDKALEDEKLYEELYDALRVMLAKALEGEAIHEVLKAVLAKAISKIIEGEVLSETLNRMLFKSLKTDIDKALVKVKEDKRKYGLLYGELNEELLKKLEDNELNMALEGLLDEALDAVLNELQEEVALYIKSEREELRTAKIDYYLEVSKTLDWFSFEYRRCGEEAKEFIKKHIDTIVESDNPNEVLEGLLLFQRYQLHKVKLIQKSQDTNDSDVDRYLDEMIKNHYNMHISIVGSFYKLLGPWAKDSFNKFLDMSPEHIKELEQHLLKLEKSSLLTASEYINTKVVTLKNLNRNNIIAFIENQSSPLKAVTVPPKPSKFDFIFLLTLLKTLISKNRDSRSFIATIKVSINAVKISRQQYKKYQEELSKVTKIYQDEHRNHMRLLVAEILGKEGAVQEEIDFKKVVRILCELGQLCRSGINSLTKKNPIIDKLFKKFNYPDTDDSTRGKLEVIAWFNEGFYGNLPKAEKDFIQQHIDKVMDCNHPRQALNALCLIYFYKLHDKTNTDTIIDAVLKNASPEVFLKEFIKKLVVMYEHPSLLAEGKIDSALNELLEQSLPSSSDKQQAPEITSKKSRTVCATNEQPIIKNSITSSGFYSSSTKDVNDVHKPYGKPVVYRPEVKPDAINSAIRPIRPLGSI